MLKLLIVVMLLTGCSSLKKFKPQGVRPAQKYLNVSWVKNLDPDHDTGNLPVAVQSPYIYDGILYLGTSKGTMNAYNLENGALIWSIETKGSFHSGPTVYNESLIYGTVEGRIYSRHYITGELQYEVDLGAPIESQGIVYRDRIFFHTRNHKIFSLDVKTGKILWAYKRSVPFLTTIQRVSRPYIEKDKLYAGFADGYVAAFNVEDGVLLWEQKIGVASKFVDVDITPLKLKSKLYVGSVTGGLTEIDAKTGTIHRTYPYTVSRAPVSFENHILFGTVDGEVVLIDRFGKEKKKIKVSKGSITSLKIWKDEIVVSTTRGELVVVSKDLSNVLETKHLGNTYSAVFGDIKVHKERLAVFSSRNRLYIFR